MTRDLLRKTQRLFHDPVLRKWLAGRMLGRWSGAAAYTPHRPPYLEALPAVTLKEPKPPRAFNGTAFAEPTGDLELPLPGETIRVRANATAAPFDAAYEDVETLLALHRFAWVPLMGDALNPAWVDALWRAWCAGFATPDDSWAWHPYTAAERAINILDFACLYGLPGDRDETLAILARHGPVIAERLEYFGERNTSNHLSNNGRGLYRLGLALGLSDCIGRGADILLKEAERIFLPSGVLREGSSHYHLLLTRNYADAWLAAREHGRPEERPLSAVVGRALAVIPRLSLPGRFPLIGDISPDCPPDFLSGFSGPVAGWVARLNGGARLAIGELIGNSAPVSRQALAANGWHRFDHGPWSGLWYASPDGWPPMPGHAHQDIGGFELHYRTDAVFIDPGRGAYGETGAAARYRSGSAHNTVLLENEDPYPDNKPYYDDTFRRRVCGEPPAVRMTGRQIDLVHDGYSRRRGFGSVRRSWRFGETGFELIDTVDGSKRPLVTRRLHTPFPVEKTGTGAVISGRCADYVVEADVPVTIEPVTAWRAYGDGEPASALVFERREKLPCELRLSVTARKGTLDAGTA